jgi:hypothetical protein
LRGKIAVEDSKRQDSTLNQKSVPGVHEVESKTNISFRLAVLIFIMTWTFAFIIFVGLVFLSALGAMGSSSTQEYGELYTASEDTSLSSLTIIYFIVFIVAGMISLIVLILAYRTRRAKIIKATSDASVVIPDKKPDTL